VLLVAEDIQWADSASLLAILSVVRQLPLAALLVVVTARPSPLPGRVRLHGRLTGPVEHDPCGPGRPPADPTGEAARQPARLPVASH
jgi:hypothetical protein